MYNKITVYVFLVISLILSTISCNKSFAEFNETSKPSEIEPKEIVIKYLTLSMQEKKDNEIKSLLFNNNKNKENPTIEENKNTVKRNPYFVNLEFSKIIKESFTEIVGIDSQEIDENKAIVIAILKSKTNPEKETKVKFILQKWNDEWKILDIPVL